MASQAWRIVEVEDALRLMLLSSTSPAAAWSEGLTEISVGSTERWRTREWPPQYPYTGLDIASKVIDADGELDVTVTTVTDLNTLTITPALTRAFAPAARIGLHPPAIALGQEAIISTGTPWHTIIAVKETLPAITLRTLAGARDPAPAGNRNLRQTISAEVAMAEWKHVYETQQAWLTAAELLANTLHADFYFNGVGRIWVLGWDLNEMMGERTRREYAVVTADVLIQVDTDEWS